jgi:hypothetical protein
MGRKIAVAAVALVPLFLFWSAARGDWDLEHPQADGKYDIRKQTTWMPTEPEITAGARF